MEAPDSKRLRFALFELDLRSQELRKEGQSVRLPPQAFRLLELLVINAGQLVSREPIRQQIWHGAVVDFEHAINKFIRQIRDALGDDAEAPKFIETLRGRGYRFIGQQTESGDARDLASAVKEQSLPALSDELPRAHKLRT